MVDLSVMHEKNIVLSKINFDLNFGEIHAVLSTSTYDLTNFVDLLEGNFTAYEPLPEIFGKKMRFGFSGKNKIDVVRPGSSQFAWLSVVENVFISQIKGIRFSKSKERVKCRQLMEHFGIDIDVCQSTDSLTHKQQKMIEMLRVYVNERPLVVLYEPINDITTTNNNPMLKIITEMKQRGQGIIYVTSKLEDALSIADRISVLDNGMIKDTFDSTEAAQNPKEVLFRLSGWNSVKYETSKKGLEILDTIVTARDIAASSDELRNEMTFLANNISRFFSASDCTIYLFNKSLSSVADTFNRTVSGRHFRIKNEILLEALKCEQMLTITSDDDKFHSAFTELDMAERSKMAVCMPVKIKDDINAVVQVVYDQKYHFDEKDTQHLHAFCKEVAIAVETSNLIGQSTLMQESHHRIKNNLQMIINLVYLQKLQAKRNKNIDVEESFDAVIRRISSIATIHNLLTADKYSKNINSFSIMIREIVKFYDVEGLTFTIEVDDISLPYNKATSVALLVNELISNCTKHAFISTTGNEICIKCRSDGACIYLDVADNGIGIIENFDITKTTSIGMSIVRSVVHGLGGQITFVVNHGTTVSVKVPLNMVYQTQ